MSVVFDFNASLNDAAPVSLMLFTVSVMRKKRSGLFDGCLSCVFYFVFTVHIEHNKCCV